MADGSGMTVPTQPTAPTGGALAAANGYTGDEGMVYSPGVLPGMMPFGMYGGMGMLGALAASAPSDSQPSPYVQNVQNISEELAGEPGTKSGPLAQFQSLKEQRDEAAQSKMAAINRAMGILQAANTHTVNLPLFAWGAGMMAPSRNFAESLSNAGREAVPVVQQQRQQDIGVADQLGRLAIAGGEVPTEQVAADEQDFLARQHLAEEYGQRGMYAEMISRGRQNVAEIQANGRLTTAQLLANRNRVKYLGPDQSDPSQGIYLDTTSGNLTYGPATQGKGVGSKAFQDAQLLVKNGVAPDLTTAYAMARAGVNNTHQFEDEVAREKALILSTPQGMKQSQDPNGMAQIEQQARETVVARASAGRAAGRGAPGAQPAPGSTAAPSSNAAPAGNGSPAAPGARPSPGPAAPPLPPGVPPTAGWSPSTKSFWWQDQNGKWQHAPGA